ncbi:MAG: TGS domain-containing protein [Candidatus Pacebacteria bacterium]|nr:TGS domain-containing protein [Candidatus Paceibacterota bacterium]
MSPEKQVENAEETLEIFAPICRRLGFNFLGQQLEEMSFPYVYPKDFAEIKNRVSNYYYEIEKYLDEARDELAKFLEQKRLHYSEIQFRKKTFFSIYKKYKKEGDFNKIYDMIALRVIVNSVPECYTALGLVHQLWLPLPGRLKDYISLPKVNGYQAIHTTVLTNNNQIVEVQIVTKDMYQNNEYGMASHWLYNLSKDTKSYTKRQNVSGLKILYKSLKNIDFQNTNSSDLYNLLVKDLLSEQIFVVTPKGDVIDLKVGSTPIDFAYKIHTSIGNNCKMAKVNHQLVSLNHILQSSDIVEIITDRKQKPNKK